MQLTYQKLTKDNIIDALKIKHQLFPESHSDEDYNNYFCGKTKSNYYLILEDNNPCATIGWYDFDNTGKNAFVGWFGVSAKIYKKNDIMYADIESNEQALIYWCLQYGESVELITQKSTRSKSLKR